MARRKNRRFAFPRALAPDELAFLLKHMDAPKWMASRIVRAQTSAAIAALHHPRRNAPKIRQGVIVTAGPGKRIQ